MKKKTLGENTCVSGKKILYIGTSEEIAKVAPVKGLEPPIFLTNTYAGYFANKSKSTRWGLIEIDIEALFIDCFAPFNEKIPKKQWKKSLQDTGVCLYTGKIPTYAIQKVVIYTPTNKFVNQRVDKVNPCKGWSRKHKENYRQNSCLSRWLLGEHVTARQWHDSNVDYNSMAVIEGNLYDRTGLFLFYVKSEKDKQVKWWKADD
jgi:hypothetical protein